MTRSNKKQTFSRRGQANHRTRWVSAIGNLAAPALRHLWDRYANRNHKAKPHRIGQRNSFKGSGSRTVTKTKKNNMSAKGDDIHSGMTSVNYKLSNGRKLPKSFLKSAPIHLDEFQYFTCDPAGTTATQGQQTPKLIAEVGTFSQGYGAPPTGALGAGTEYPTFQASVPFIDLTPNNSITNSAYFGAGITSFTSQTKIILRACEVQLMLRNQGTAPCHVDVYFLQVKKHIPRPTAGGAGTFNNKTPMDIWSDGIDQMSVGKALQTFINGSGAWGAPAAGKEAYQMPYARPQESKYFGQFYKIAKVHSVDLAAGAVENIAAHLNVNLVYDYAKDMQQLQLDYTNPAQTLQSDNAFRLQSRAGAFNIVTIVRGSPMIRHDGGYPIISGHEVIGSICKKHIFGLVKENNKKFGTVQAYDYVDTNVPPANQKQIDINDVNDVLKAAG